jgi:uncharacterized SAM-binding protein YcdF (DUF218 family)
MLRRLILYVALTLAVGWLGGLLLFVTSVTLMREPAITPDLVAADGIVVLTGGSERLNVGVDLLKAGKGRKLLVSGVNPTISQEKILAGQDVPERLRDCCILMGRMADSTIGNAEETRTWIAAEKLTSIRLVTANYHMPRSLYIFRRALPGITVIPHPIMPDSVMLTRWWERTGTANLLINEYHKFLLVLLSIQVDWLT